jgi:tetratricopeptide (TPR) repeat protein
MKRAALPGLLLSLFLAWISGPAWSAETKPGPGPKEATAACKPIKVPETAKAGPPDRTPDVWLAMANRLYDEKRWAEARDAYLQYLASSPHDPNARTDFGVTLRELGEPETALEHFDCVIALDPGHWQTLYNKILVLGFDLARKPEAEALLVTLRQLQPDNDDVEALAKALKEQ